MKYENQFIDAYKVHEKLMDFRLNWSDELRLAMGITMSTFIKMRHVCDAFGNADIELGDFTIKLERMQTGRYSATYFVVVHSDTQEIADIDAENRQAVLELIAQSRETEEEDRQQELRERLNREMGRR